MKKRFTLVFLFIAVALVTVACKGGSSGDGGSGADSGGEDNTLYFYNWSEYIEPELLTKFQQETGISVVEVNFSNNEELLAKLQSGATGYDVIVPSDYMVVELIDLGLVAELDKSQLTTLDYLGDQFTDPSYDPGLVHCVPYMWGTTGIAFNWNDWDDYPTSWATIFDPEQIAEFDGEVTMLNDPREVLGAALIYLGYSPNTQNEAEIEEAKNLVLAIKPYIAAFDSDGYEERLVAGESRLAHGWSGDVFTAQVEDENIDYAIPEEGAVLWTDNLCITAEAGEDSGRFERAHKFIDFLNTPENAGVNVNYVWYATPNEAANEYIDQEILDYPAVYPSDEVMSKLTPLEPVGDAIEFYDRAWTEILSE